LDKSWERTTLVGRNATFSPDGTALAFTESDKKGIRLLNFQSRKERIITRNDTDIFSSVAFSPDSKTLASGDEAGGTKLWDVQSGTEVGMLPRQKDAVHSLAFSPDGQKLATGSNMTLKLWEVKSGKERLNLHENAWFYLYSDTPYLAFSHDGRTLATWGFEGITLWDTTSGRKLISFFLGGEEIVSSVAFTPDSRQLFSVCGDKVILWDIGSGHNIVIHEDHKGILRSVFIRPNGKVVAFGSAGAGNCGLVMMWEMAAFPFWLARLWILPHTQFFLLSLVASILLGLTIKRRQLLILLRRPI
jgi:WD40 repeat protein